MGSRGQEGLHAQTIRAPPPQEPSPKTLGTRTWEEGGVCFEPSKKTLCVRARRRLRDEVTEWLHTHTPPTPARVLTLPALS